MELCGARRERHRGLGGFKIISEAGIAAGVPHRGGRRPGRGGHARRPRQVVSAGGVLRVPPEEIAGRVSSLMETCARRRRAGAARQLAAAKSVASPRTPRPRPAARRCSSRAWTASTRRRSSRRRRARRRRRRRRRRWRRRAGLGERGRQGPGGGLDEAVQSPGARQARAPPPRRAGGRGQARVRAGGRPRRLPAGRRARARGAIARARGGVTERRRERRDRIDDETDDEMRGMTLDYDGRTRATSRRFLAS